VGYFEVSAKEGLNVDEAFFTVAAMAYEIENFQKKGEGDDQESVQHAPAHYGGASLILVDKKNKGGKRKRRCC